MDEYQTKLEKAIGQQKLTSSYELFIRSPLLEQEHLPQQSKDEKKNTSLSLRIPPVVRNMLDEIADQEGTNISSLIINAITSGIRKHNDTQEARTIYINQMIKEQEALAARLSPDEGITAILRQLKKDRSDSE